MQGITQNGSGNIAVQISGSGNTVAITCAGVRLQLLAKHAEVREPRSEIDLLRPETRLLDLIGRDAEIASLNGWLDDPRNILVRGLIGRAGTGKTRLAIELCKRAAAAGWTAGFLDSGDLGAFVEAQRTADWQVDEPILIVIDYAGRRSPAINAWLLSLARRGNGTVPKLRLLLLERHGSSTEGWWNETTRLDGSDDRLYDFFDQPEPVELPPIGTSADRRAILSGAIRKSCELHQKPPIHLPPAGDDPWFDSKLAGNTLAAEPLFLMMAGLAAVHYGLPTVLTLGRLDLALEIACWERDRLRRLAADRKVNETLILHLVACITLCRGMTRKKLKDLIAEERAALPYESGVEYEKLSSTLDIALPVQAGDGEETVTGLEPDIIGEAFWLLILTTNKDLDQSSLINRCRDRASVGTVQSLVLAIQDFARPPEELAGASTRRPESRLLQSWLGQGNPALGWLRQLSESVDDVDELMAIAGQMPDDTLIMREFLSGLMLRIVSINRANAGNREILSLELLSRSLNDLSVRLSQLGQREGALRAAQESAELYRTLAKVRSDLFSHHLAMSLHNLANRLSELERVEEAFYSAQEACRLYRTLNTIKPNFFNSELAMTLNGIAVLHSKLGQKKAALHTAREAVDLYRKLAQANSTIFTPNLAGALVTLSNQLTESRYLDEALQMAQEACGLFRTLAAGMPDILTHRLAGALYTLSKILMELGQPEEALRPAQESVDFYKKLFSIVPDAFRDKLSYALMNLYIVFNSLNNDDEAIRIAMECIKIRNLPTR